MVKLNSIAGTWSALALLGLVFGSAFLFVKMLAEPLAPMQLVAARLGIAALVVSALLAVRGDLPSINAQLLRGAAALGVFDYLLPYALLAWASGSINSGNAAVLMASMPLFTAVFSFTFPSGERLTHSKIAGLAIGFVGVAVIVGPEALDLRSGVGLPQLAVLIGALSYGWAGVYGRKLSQSYSALDITVLKLVLAAAAAAALSAAVDGSPTSVSLDRTQFGALLTLGAVSTGLGRLLYLQLIAAAGSVKASTVTYIIPVVALALGWLILDEAISLGTVAGVLLILAGVIGVVSPTVAPGPRLAEPVKIGGRAPAV